MNGKEAESMNEKSNAAAQNAVYKENSAVTDQIVTDHVGTDPTGSDFSSEAALVRELSARGWTVCCAESCTGGLLCGRIVDYPGASAVLCESYVTYSNEAKHRLLGVSWETLEQYGAVSAETAMEMARGAARASGAQTALSVTGIAGPTGAVEAHDGREAKPVGLVYLGFWVNGEESAERWVFTKDRRGNREEAVLHSILGLLQRLKNK